MKKVFFNILPVLAIVAGIAGAFGFDAKQNPCEEDGHTGYSQPIDDSVGPEHSNNTGIQNYGQFGDAFVCDGDEGSCHWVYDSGTWTECQGDRVPPTR